LWTYACGGPIKSAAALLPGGDGVVFGAHDGRARCVDFGDVARWTSAFLGGAVYATPVPVGDDVVVAATTANGALHGLDAATGAPRWTHRGTGAPVYARPRAHGGRVYYGDVAGWCRCLEGGGESVWAAPGTAPIYSPPLAALGALFVADDRGVVARRALGDGAAAWTRPLDGKVFGAIALLAPDRLVVATTPGRVHVLAAGDGGATLAVCDVRAETFSSPVVVRVGGVDRVFLGCRDDTLKALDVVPPPSPAA